MLRFVSEKETHWRPFSVRLFPSPKSLGPIILVRLPKQQCASPVDNHRAHPLEQGSPTSGI